jgi:hypothetical protein
MDKTQKRKFVGTVRVGKSSTEIEFENTDEMAVTELLELLYGTENIIEVRAADESDGPDQTSQAESDVGKRVTRNLWAVLGSVTKWMMLGTFKRCVIRNNTPHLFIDPVTFAVDHRRGGARGRSCRARSSNLSM